MTRLINDAQHFAAESLAGFAAAHSTDVHLVPDAGATSTVVSAAARVAVVMGGGSGHHPAFLGWVGPGLVDGAVSGNIFSSPSATQVERVAEAASQGHPVLLLPINYAGDILHFSEARDRMRAEGRDVRLVAVTDDIASAPADEAATRRGIAGSFIVAKIVGAAVQAGASIDDVERLAQKANDVTRSLGLAFSGCTLPGSAGPNFDVPEGKMALGLGIHGEPGLRMLDLESADHAADVLVDELFQERPPLAGTRVAVLVNGLGATKYDELHVVFARIAKRIESAGMTLVAPVIGELVTSLDMAGVSLSVTYLDDELEELWQAPAHSAAFTRTAPDARSAVSTRTTAPADANGPDAAKSTPAQAPASAASIALAAQIVDALSTTASEMALRADELAHLDSVAGDGDHGACMQRGSAAAHAAASEAVNRGAGAAAALDAAGDAWSNVGGGTSGALWGAGVHAAGAHIDDDVENSADTLRVAVEAFAQTIAERGGASVGDKTMLDAIVPFASALSAGISAGDAPGAAWHAAAAAADAAAQHTAEFAARRGRSRTHGDASLGTPDPGAVSFALIVAALDPQTGADAADGRIDE